MQTRFALALAAALLVLPNGSGSAFGAGGGGGGAGSGGGAGGGGGGGSGGRSQGGSTGGSSNGGTSVQDCRSGKVWDKKHQKCVEPKQGMLDDESLYEVGARLAKAGRYGEAISVLGYVANKADPARSQLSRLFASQVGPHSGWSRLLRRSSPDRSGLHAGSRIPRRGLSIARRCRLGPGTSSARSKGAAARIAPNMPCSPIRSPRSGKADCVAVRASGLGALALRCAGRRRR